MHTGKTHCKFSSAIFATYSIFAMGLLLLCSACTTTDPNWRAPVEIRTAGQQVNQPTKSPSGVKTYATTPKWTTIQPSISPSAKFYVIHPGDTLFSIAWRSNNTAEQLAEWNQIKPPYVIYPGQRLRLYAPPRTPVANTTKPTVKITQTKPSKTVKPIKPVIKPKKVLPNGQLNWDWPLSGKLAATYQANDPSRKGIKIIGQLGDTIKAAESGRVVYSGNGLIGYGLLVIIKHNEKYLSAYGHNRKLLVKQGQQITKGTKIAELGTTNAGKAQLHFEIRRQGKPVNPLNLLPKR